MELSAPITVQLEESSQNDMLKRFVSPDGKTSTSRFRFLSYDSNNDLSIVAACPITGRGHQLRLHLQLLGFPIHNDVEYGGRIDDEEKKRLQNMSIEAILSAASQEKNEQCLRDDSVVSEEEAASAIKVCTCCSDGREGVQSSYKEFQLLGAGQAIDLHAVKYCIGSANEHKTDFVTELPKWAASTSKAGLNWLN